MRCEILIFILGLIVLLVHVGTPKYDFLFQHFSVAVYDHTPYHSTVPCFKVQLQNKPTYFSFSIAKSLFCFSFLFLRGVLM